MCFMCIFEYKKKSKNSSKKFSIRIMIPNISKFRESCSLTSLKTLIPKKSSASLCSADTLLTTLDYNENVSDSITDFQNFDKILTNALLDTTIDRLSLLNISSGTQLEESESNKTLKAFNEEIQTLRHIDSVIDNSIPETINNTKPSIPTNDELYTNLALIQRDIMPKWSEVNENERNQICTMLTRWQGIIKSNFDRNKSKQKSIKDLKLDENKYANKGKFNFNLNRIHMKKLQLDLFKCLGGEQSSSTVKIKPNARLILRAFKKFDDVFICLENSSKYEFDDNNKKLYWFNLNKYLHHTSKAILRCALYIYENAHLNKCSLGSPPIYAIESDFCDEADVPYISFETLYEYIYLCLSQLDTINKAYRRKNGHCISEVDSQVLCLNELDGKRMNKKTLISKNYTLMLNCLIRLLQISKLIRENLTMKQKVFSIDIYSHVVEHECRLLREYLKEILKNE